MGWCLNINCPSASRCTHLVQLFLFKQISAWEKPQVVSCLILFFFCWHCELKPQIYFPFTDCHLWHFQFIALPHHPPPPSYPIVVMNLFTTANNFSYMWIFFSWSPKITGCVFRWGASAATRASVVSHACRHRTTDAACVCVFRREGTHYPLPRPQMSGRAMLKEFLYVFGININADCFRGAHPSKNANGVFKIYTSLQSVFMQRCSVILTALLH